MYALSLSVCLRVLPQLKHPPFQNPDLSSLNACSSTIPEGTFRLFPLYLCYVQEKYKIYTHQAVRRDACEPKVITALPPLTREPINYEDCSLVGLGVLVTGY